MNIEWDVVRGKIKFLVVMFRPYQSVKSITLQFTLRRSRDTGLPQS